MPAEVTPAGREALGKGKLELRLKRQGIYQRIEFVVKRFPVGKEAHVALCCERIVDAGEMERLAAELGLPIFSANGKIFPKGTGASDFVGL
ncbi:MAG: hypothetical protein WC759_02560 [Candidatus Micrarchaeia archaeon]